MHIGQRQVIAEKVSSTVRVLELLGLKYEVNDPKNARAKGNKSPRIVSAYLPGKKRVRVYNGIEGRTWAYIDEGGQERTGKPIPGISSIEDLYIFLKKRLGK